VDRRAVLVPSPYAYQKASWLVPAETAVSSGSQPGRELLGPEALLHVLSGGIGRRIQWRLTPEVLPHVQSGSLGV
jgi:hypothetical protein